MRAVILLFRRISPACPPCQLFSGPLETSFRVITPDLRGAGKSVFGANLSWDVLADDVAALAAALGVARAVVCGVSFGAGCAVRVALRHPALVMRLVLLHPAYGGAELGLCAAQRAAMACDRTKPGDAPPPGRVRAVPAARAPARPRCRSARGR